MRTEQNNYGDDFTVTSDRLHRLAQRTATFRRRRKEYAGLFSKVGLMLLLLPVLMWQCQEDDFQGELVGICPEVIYTDPINDTINVALTKQVSATFNEYMNPLTINEDTYLLHQGTTLISGTVTYSGATALFSPDDPFTPNTVYTGTITTGAQDPMGNALVEDYVWSFTTLPQYMVQLSSNPTAGGTTTGGGLFFLGAVVVVTANANPGIGYTFINWTEGDLDASPNESYTFTLLSDRILVANFSLNSHTLIVISEHGSVEKDPSQASYTHDASVVLTPTPEDGYTFTGWSGDATGSDSPLTVIMDADKTITALFSQNVYTLTVLAEHGSAANNPDLLAYTPGASVVLTPTADAGYTFTGWSGDATGNDSSLTVTMDGNKTITAIFTQNTYTLTVLAEHGSVAKDPLLLTYTHGASVVLTPTAEVGYTFTGWSGDATGSANPLTVTMDASKTITALFTQNEYTLTVVAEHGSVAKDPLLLTYTHGASVELTPTADVGYTFTGWSGDATGSANPLTVTMDGSKTIAALFTQNEYTLTVLAEHGSVAKDPLLLTYIHGASVVLTPTAEVGYTFAGWSGDATGSANPLTVTMDGSKTITALFTQNEYTLTVVAEHGSVTKDPLLLTYTHGASVELTPTAEVGYTFTGWSGDATGSANPLTVTMDGSKTITALFTQNEYTLTVVAEHGSVAKDPLLLTYTHGASVELTPTAEVGYTFTGWSGDATGSANPLTVTMDASKTITALFTQNEYTLTVLAEHGSVAKDPSQASYIHGSSVVLTPTAEVGYTFTGWSGDATGSANPLTVTMDASKTITALFTQNEYTLTVVAEHGSVAKDPLLLTYTHGASVELTPTAEVGYTFTGWSGDATGSANPLTVTMDASKTITALFTQNEYTLTVVAEHGSVAKDPSQASYIHGSSVVLTPTAEVGYTFTGWSGDAIGSANPLTVTMDASKTITALFTQNEYTLTVLAEHGSVAKDPSQTSYTHGASVELTPTADAGYTFTGWSGDATGSANPLTVTMDGSKTITALFTENPPVGPGLVDLGTASDFVILTKTGISSDVGTLITGNIGVNPAASTYITGFGLIMDVDGTSSHTPMVIGSVYAPNYAAPTPAKMVTAHNDMLTAYTAANNLVTPAPVTELGGGNISGMTLAPGLYKWTTGLLITNAGVTLEGGPNDTWVFQVAQNLTVNNSAIVTLLGGAQAKNIVWVVAGQANLGSDTSFKGILMTYELISLNTGASVTGRLFAQTAVTLAANCTVIEPD